MSDKGRDCASELVAVEVSVDFTKNTLLSSAHEHEQRHSANETIVIVTQFLERSQLSDKGRNCAIQLVGVETSVDFTKHTLLSSAHEHEHSGQRKTKEL